MMKKFAVLLLVISCLSFTQSNKKLVMTRVSNKLSLLVPKEMFKLSDDDALKRYGQWKLPMAVYENQEKDVSLSVSLKKFAEPREFSDEDLKIEKSFLKASHEPLYLQVNYLRDEIQEIKGEKFIVFEFESVIQGENAEGELIRTKQYNMLANGYLKKKSYVINFSCPLNKKDEWQESANEILQSISMD